VTAFSADIGLGLRLTPIATDHAAALARLVRQNLVRFNAFLPAVAALTAEADALHRLQQSLARIEDGELLEWHLFDGDTLCGSVRLKEIDHEHGSAAIGYLLGGAFAGKGIATAAVSAVLRHAFETLGLRRISLVCASGNDASARLAERLGFVREGTFRQAECLHGAIVDLHSYGLLRDEWTAGAGNATMLTT
jgi:ribosomal-protein-serine acetyltransferase